MSNHASKHRRNNIEAAAAIGSRHNAEQRP